MRTKVIIAVVVALFVSGVLAALIVTKTDAPGHRVADGTFSRPMPWVEVAGARAGVISPVNATMTVGELTLSAPQPAGVEVTWTHTLAGDRERLVGEGQVAGQPARFEWLAARGNPHTVFSGTATATRGALTDPLVSIVDLPDGEVTYVNNALTRVPFAGTPIQLSALTKGPIIWRNGEDALALWQWHADRLVLTESESGGVQIQVYWWDPTLHPVPESCAKELNDVELTLNPRMTISFGEVPQVGFGRLPHGVTSAVVPLFIDPQNLEDVRFHDGASAGAEDFVNRARTIAFGHSSISDARYGNGGLAGLDVGGTIAVPDTYELTSDAFAELRETTSAAKIELVPEKKLRPDDCKDLAASLAESAPVLRASRPFDGKFPNLFATDQRDAIPGVMGQTAMWQPTALTGRRKDVVTQALSSTYLTRLADVRGVALLEIPIVATRNPLVAVAAEALLEPERNGQWTIEESVARALGEVELLSEDDRFDFIGLQGFASYVRALQHVEIGQVDATTWTVFNRGPALEGFTLVFEHEVEVTVDGAPPQSALRTLGNGARQTWVWWDLADTAPYEVKIEADVAPQPVMWSVAE